MLFYVRLDFAHVCVVKGTYSFHQIEAFFEKLSQNGKNQFAFSADFLESRGIGEISLLLLDFYISIKVL